MDKRGPGKIVLVGIALITIGLGMFAFGVGHAGRLPPLLLVGLAVHGHGHGLHDDAAVRVGLQALAPHRSPAAQR